MQLSMRWAERSKTAFVKRKGYGIFGIMQGGMFADLRKISAASILCDIGFDGYAIGGLAVGEPKEEMLAMLEIACPLLPMAQPTLFNGSRQAHRFISGHRTRCGYV